MEVSGQLHASADTSRDSEVKMKFPARPIYLFPPSAYAFDIKPVNIPSVSKILEGKSSGSGLEKRD
jgi:hypothetical protein